MFFKHQTRRPDPVIRPLWIGKRKEARMYIKDLFAASPVVDRLRLTASNEDSEDGADGAGSDISEDDENQEGAEKSEQEDGEEGDKGKGKDDEDLDEEEKTYKKRFSDTKADRDEIARERNLLREELAALRNDVADLKSKQDSGDITDEEVDAIAEDLFKRVSSVSKDDPEYGKKVYREIGRDLARLKKEIISTLKTEESQKTKQTSEAERARQDAEENAKIALEEAGLDPEKHFKLFQKEVDDLMAKKPNWFKVVPPQEQFLRIAERVSKQVKSSKEANAEHRKESGGVMSGGSKVNKKSNQQEDDDGEPDTMIGAMNAHKRDQYKLGARMHKLAQQR